MTYPFSLIVPLGGALLLMVAGAWALWVGWIRRGEAKGGEFFVRAFRAQGFSEERVLFAIGMWGLAVLFGAGLLLATFLLYPSLIPYLLKG